MKNKPSKKVFDNWDCFLQETLPRLKKHNENERRGNAEKMNNERTKSEPRKNGGVDDGKNGI